MSIPFRVNDLRNGQLEASAGFPNKPDTGAGFQHACLQHSEYLAPRKARAFYTGKLKALAKPPLTAMPRP